MSHKGIIFILEVEESLEFISSCIFYVHQGEGEDKVNTGRKPSLLWHFLDKGEGVVTGT